MRIITFLISLYTLSSLLLTVTDLAAIKDVQAATVQPEQPEQPTHRGNGRR